MSVDTMWDMIVNLSHVCFANSKLLVTFFQVTVEEMEFFVSAGKILLKILHAIRLIMLCEAKLSDGKNSPIRGYGFFSGMPFVWAPIP